MPDTTLELRNASQSRKDELVYNLFGETGKPGMIRHIKEFTESYGFNGNSFSLRDAANLEKNIWKNAFKFLFAGSSPPLIEVKTSTNYARVLRWDGTYGPVVTGANGLILLEANVMTFTSPNYGTSIATPYNTNIPKFCAILPCASNGATNSSYTISKIAITPYSASNITEIDLPESLTHFDSGRNAIRNYDFSRTNASVIEVGGGGSANSVNVNKQTLTSITVLNSDLRYLDLSNCPLLTTVYCANSGELISLDLSNCPSLTTFNCLGNKLTSLNLQGCTSLTSLTAHSNFLTSIDLSEFANLTYVDVSQNKMSSVEHDNMYNSMQVIPPGGYIKSIGQLGGVTSASATKRAALVAAGWFIES